MSEFSIITEEFRDELATIRSLVGAFSDAQNVPKQRIAAANSATLLLAATFEEFVRQMARAYARSVIAAAENLDRLPRKLVDTVWRRTMEALARMRLKANVSLDNVFADAQARFNVVYTFCNGDLSQDIYEELIHNENNMRPTEINSLFKVSDLGDVCFKLADKTALLENVGETEAGKAHGRMLGALDEFFDRRNEIAHSLRASRSSGPDQIFKDIEMLNAFGRSLCETLDAVAPRAVVVNAPVGNAVNPQVGLAAMP